MNFPSFNPDIAKALPEYTKRSPYCALLGIEIEDVGPGTIRVSLPVSDGLHSGVGAVHGGAIVSLVDHALSLAVYPLVEIGKWVATLEYKINYLAPVKMGAEPSKIIADARVLSLKKTLAVVRADVMHGDKLVAIAQGTDFIREKLA